MTLRPHSFSTRPKRCMAPPFEPGFIDNIFPNAPAISIDYAIMEKADNVFVKTVDLGWSDLGTWNALYDASPKNAEGNVTQNCKVLATDCADSMFAVNGDKIIVASGLKDYIVADNGNALLIYPKRDEQKDSPDCERSQEQIRRRLCVIAIACGKIPHVPPHTGVMTAISRGTSVIISATQ